MSPSRADDLAIDDRFGQTNKDQEMLNELSAEEIKIIKIFKESQIDSFERGRIEYQYLYWACLRGNPFIVNHIITTYRISPFLCAVDGKSPFLIAIESNQTAVVKYLLSK